MMNKFSSKDALRSYMLEGNPLSVLEGMLYFGVQSPRGAIHTMRKEGYLIGRHKVPMAQILTRMNKHTQILPPKDLPTTEILMTEYWIKK